MRKQRGGTQYDGDIIHQISVPFLCYSYVYFKNIFHQVSSARFMKPTDVKENIFPIKSV